MEINMLDTKVGQLYEITGFDSDYSSDSILRLMQYGFIEGTKLKVLRKAPVFKDPMLIELRGSQIVISKDEASCIQVKLVE